MEESTENLNMADTPTTVRKRILSITPPNTTKPTGSEDKPENVSSSSPKLIQDVKKRVVVIEDECETKAKKPTGYDPKRSGDSGQQTNMAAQNENNTETAKTKAISSNPEGTVNAPLPANEVDGNNNVPQPANDPVSDISQRVTRSAVRRGRPRRLRGLSVDPPIDRISTEDGMMKMLQNIQTNMSNNSLHIAKFESNLISSIDSKFCEIKNLYDSNIVKLQSEVGENSERIGSMQIKLNELDVKAIDMDSRFAELDDEILACRKLTETSTHAINDHVSQTETALAKDIEQIRISAEVKFNESQNQQQQLENRFQDMNEHIDTETQRLSRELEDVKLRFSELQTIVDSIDTTSLSVNSGSVNTHSNNCSKCQNCSEDSSSTGSVFREEGAGVQPPPITQNRLNSYRSLIIDGVLEYQYENLAALCLHFVRDMGIRIDPDDIEVAFRLGKPDRSKSRPRPVKLVLKSEVLRDQIFHFKLRLRKSKLYKSLQVMILLKKREYKWEF